MVSLEDWASMDETAYFLASPANRAALEQAIQDRRDGKFIEVTMEQLEALEAE